MEVREYVTELDLNMSEIQDMRATQYAIFEGGFGKENNPNSVKYIADQIGDKATAVGFIFLRYTAVGIATGIINVIAGIASTEKSRLKTLVRDGHYHMQKLENFLRDYKEFDRIKVKLPFIEYNTVDGKIRFVIGEGLITGARYKNGGWISDM
ncbi:hypothetical protein [Paenibacillus dendritiformis]|uniref:Uncharacterized protein n=1 Tax=Paenibacillus dendritiformis C454 TaxID=1131935 RepID=H3SL82_9BACL|nr:hypothetical protein [Paenibacillus dendritiformis]EHQ60179.1 hypothetical protein PDENDC454_21584 [Paenibacillus dendritiformis C454]TDL50267.1 hypothetical protein E2R60_22235 [Paenibacillus dendritiformis]CAH8768836.1 hypothetical protein H7S4_001534 [Paenibacillus dendritiformis]